MAKLLMKCMQMQLVKQTSDKSTLIITCRSASHWNKDFKPAPYPSTAAQSINSAKKYNMFPEEYRPYADNGIGYGDYPRIDGGWGNESKDFYYPYDFPEHKRNFREPLMADVDLYGEDRYTQVAPTRFQNRQYFLTFFGAMTCFAIIYIWCNNKKMFRPVIPKQYPINGVHYTFEPRKK